MTMLVILIMYIGLFNCNYFISYFVLYICKENWKQIGLTILL